MPVATPVTTTQDTQIGNNDPAGQTIPGSATTPFSFFGATPVPQILQGTLLGVNGELNVNAVSSSPTSVLANSTSEKSFTVVGVASTDMVVAAIKPTSQAGLGVGTARVSATNTILLTMGNATNANLTPTTTETYLFVTVPVAMQFSAVLTVAGVAGATSVEQTFNVPGVQPGMVVAVNKPTLTAGLMITNCRVVAPGVVGITFMNVTASTTLTPTAAQTYSFFASQGLRRAPVLQNIPATLTPVSVAANTTAEQTFTIASMGLASGQPVFVTTPSLPAGLGLTGARMSAANTLALNFANSTAAALTPPAGVYQVGYFSDPNVPAAAAQTMVAATVGVDPGNEMNRLGLTA